MNVMPMETVRWSPADLSGQGLAWTEHKRRARQTLRRATQVLVVLALGGVLHAMRWAGMIVL